jgi:hypothetical protein
MTPPAADAAARSPSEMPGPTLTRRGLVVPWRWICLAAAALASGAGGAAGWSLLDATGAASAADLGTFRAEQTTQHARIDGDLATTKTTLTAQGAALGTVQQTVSSIQDVQHRTVARDEARRVTAPVRDRATREAAYDRLLERNLARLRAGRDPCATLDCP